MSMGNPLTGFFQPRNVALIGASDRSEWSRLIHSRFGAFGHQGNLYAINRDGKPAHGLPGFKNCGEIGQPVDMAYIFVPANAVGQALRDAGDAGIKHAVVLTSGFAEVDAEGAAMQLEITEIARSYGIRMLGPNSLGFANIAHGSVTTSMPPRLPLRQGRLAVVSQSGAITSELNKYAHNQGIGLSFMAATGNEADIGIAEIVDYLVDDDAVGAIALYIESIKSPAAFAAAAARAAAAKKPIVLLKLGRSPMSAAIAQAHTGSLVGDDGIFDAMCKRYAISRVMSLEELILTANLLANVGPISPPRIGMASMSGGACAIYVDLAEAHGLAVPQYAEDTQARLREVLPGFASTLNPLDVTGAVMTDPSIWARALPIACSDPNMGLVVAFTVVPNSPVENATLGANVIQIGEGYRASGQPAVVGTTIMQDAAESRFELLAEAGVAAFLPNLDVGVRALAHLQRWSENLAVYRPEIAAGDAAPAGKLPGSERETLAYLASYGVPVIPSVLVQDGQAAAKAVAELGLSVLKIASPDIAHKTEAGGVRLRVEAADAATVFDEIIASVKAYAPTAAIDGVLVGPMRGDGIELVIGVTRDPEWGLALTVGFGGVLTELLADSATRLLPVDRSAVIEMLGALRGAKLLAGYRGQAGVDIERLAEIIAGVGQAALGLGPTLAALEVNPLRASGGLIEALDGLTIYHAAG